MEKIEFLPLGTVVVLNGAVKKVMITQRAVNVGDENNPDAEPKYYDYGAVLYPEGLVEGRLVYFNRDDIYRIIHEGYSDKDDELMIDEINEALTQIQEQVEIENKEFIEEQDAKEQDEDPFGNLSDAFNDED